MFTGAIVMWKEDRGFGFIGRADGEDVFVHVTALAGSGKMLSPGQRVAFDIVTDRGGKARAENVRLL